MDEKKCLENLKLGKADSYEPLVKKYQNHIYQICLAQVGRSDIAEELAQETFLKAYKAITTLKDHDKFFPWLKRIAANLCRDHQKSPRSHFISLDDRSNFKGLKVDEPYRDARDDYESQALERELYSRLYDLDLEKRNLLLLYYLYELPGSLIAEKLSISSDLFKKRLERARNALKEVIEMKTDNSPGQNFSARIIELIKRPNLIETPNNPVGEVWKEICQFLGDYKVIEGEELISKEMHELLAQGQPCLDAVEVDKERVLRSHTTTIVMDYLKEHPDSPCKVVGVGRVWRDAIEDKNHLKMFHQMDALCMGAEIREGDLLPMINDFMETILPGKQWSLRNEAFPFTKRGYVINVETENGLLDVAGAGEIKEETLASYGVDPSKFKAVAYGVGLERMAMAKFGLETVQDATTVKL